MQVQTPKLNLTKHFQSDKKDLGRGALRTAQLKKKIDKMLTLDIV